MKGRIFKSSGRDFECQDLESKRFISAKAKGSLLKEGELVVGDYVELEEEGEGWIITALNERENFIDRFIVRERKTKIIAANVDLIVLVMTVSLPEYKRGLVDRYLIRAMDWQIPLVLVFNKADEPLQEGLNLEFEHQRVKDLIVECFEISAINTDHGPQHLKDQQNFSSLKLLLEGKTALFVGQSGVGKSKTISALTNGQQVLASKEIGKMGKGSHTTTWAELVDCYNFYVVDSPGIRSFSLDDLYVENLPDYFPDLMPYFGGCKFNDCSHGPSQKGCAFQELTDSLEHRVLRSRLDSFLRIQQELEKTPTWKKKKRS